MEAPIPNINPILKTKEIEHDGKKYICQFHIIGESLDVSIILLNSLKNKGSITLEKIKEQNFHFSEYNIDEILKEINLLDMDNFSIIKKYNKYK